MYDDYDKYSLNSSELTSPASQYKDPLSPHRVEFADEVLNFSPAPTVSSRPGSRCESPNPKGILRHTLSDPQRAAGRSNTVELSNIEQSNVDRTDRNDNVAVRSNTTGQQLPLNLNIYANIYEGERERG